MEIDKINTFLATAIGGLIFKWLIGGISAFWSWLNTSYPEEDFLISKIGISKPIIRLSLCKYKLSTKPHIKKHKIFIVSFGIAVIMTSAFCFYKFTYIIAKEPVNLVEITHRETKDSFWMKPEHAQNIPYTSEWNITPDVCVDKSQLDKITSIQQATKDFICSYLLIPEKQEELAKTTDKNKFTIMIATPIIYLSILFIFMIGIAMFIDLYIDSKITKFHKLEIDKSYQYLT